MLPKKLSGKALRHLRALGHALDPVVAVGKQGVTDALVEQTERALASHELIKVRVMREAPLERAEAAEELAGRTGAVLAQVIGRTFLLYKRHATRKKPKIVLPKEVAAGGPKAVAARGRGGEGEQAREEE